MAIRYLFIVLAFGLSHLVGVRAQEIAAELDYNPSVCWNEAEHSPDCLAMMQAFRSRN